MFELVSRRLAVELRLSRFHIKSKLLPAAERRRKGVDDLQEHIGRVSRSR
jgi:hypothetical protein